MGRSYFSGFIFDILCFLKEFSHHFISASKSLLILTEKTIKLEMYTESYNTLHTVQTPPIVTQILMDKDV